MERGGRYLTNVVSPAGSDTPLISIVIACFNAAETLDAAIRSVVAEADDNVELIVIDGGSVDGTQAIIERHAGRLHHWISERDRGIYDAWNKGVRASYGRYIGFLGADDVLLPGAIAAYRQLIAAAPDAEYLSGRVRYGARIIGQPWRWSRFRRYMTVAHVASLHRRSLFDRIGLFDESFAITGDYELLLRAGPTLQTAFMSDVTVDMGVGGISSGQSDRVFHEASRAKRLHSGLPATIIVADRWRAKAGFRLRRILSR